MATNEELQLQVQAKIFEELSTKETELREILNTVDEIIFRCDQGLAVTWVNNAWHELLGYSESSCIGITLDSFTATDRDAAILQHLIYRQGENADYNKSRSEVAMLNDKGEPRVFRVCINRSRSGYIGSMVDITLFSETLGELRDREAEANRLSLVASKTENMVVITSAQGEIEWVNQSFEKTTGYSSAEVIGRKPGSFLQGELTDPRVIQEMREAVARNEGFKVDVVNYNRQGQPYWVTVDCTVVLDEKGTVSNFLAIESDISERKQAEEVLKRSEAQYRFVVENAREAIFRIDANQRVSFANAAWYGLVGLEPEAVIGRKLSEFLQVEDTLDFSSRLEQLVSGGSDSLREEYLFKNLHSESFQWCEIFLTPPEIIDGGSSGKQEMAGMLISIDQRKQAELELRAAKEKAERLLAQRTEFVANISHEIRTPLNAILGLSELLTREKLNTKQESYVSSIKDGGNALLGIVNDVLDFSKLEHKDVELECIRFDLFEAYESSIRLFAEQAAIKGLYFRSIPSIPLPRYIYGDPVRFKQVLCNLIGNAIKFTKHGGITVLLEAEHSDADSSLRDGLKDLSCCNIKMSIYDTGIGIDEPNVGLLFEVFGQADSATTRQYGGTGLGLAICKQIVDVWQGQIEAKNLKQGSCFSVVLPCQYEKEGAFCGVGKKPSLMLFDDKGQPVFAVKDYALAYLQWMLAQPASCTNLGASQEGYADIEALISGETVLFTALEQRVATSRQIARQLPAQFLVSNEPESLAEIELRRPLRVLIAEDIATNRLILEDILESLGCEYLSVHNGQEALDACTKQYFDVVLMDLHMPVLDGVESGKGIVDYFEGRSAGEWAPKIYAVTADVLAETKQSTEAAGISGHIAKPYASSEISDALFSDTSTVNQLNIGSDFGLSQQDQSSIASVLGDLEYRLRNQSSQSDVNDIQGAMQRLFGSNNLGLQAASASGLLANSHSVDYLLSVMATMQSELNT